MGTRIRGGGGVTGVDVEHTKAQLADVRVVLAPSRVSLAVPTASPMDAARQALNIATALVAAVERVQALHTPVCEHSGANCKEEDCCMLICQECGTDHPCETRKALEAP